MSHATPVWKLDVHGGLTIKSDGTYSAEKGIDPDRDVARAIQKGSARVALLSAWQASRRATEGERP